MHDSVEGVSFAIRSEEMSPALIVIGWHCNEWGYDIQIYSASRPIYHHWAGNSPWDSAQSVSLNKALSLDNLREYAQHTAKEIAEELGLDTNRVYEEE